MIDVAIREQVGAICRNSSSGAAFSTESARFDRFTLTPGRVASRRAALGLGAGEAVAGARKMPCPPCQRRKHGKCKPAPDGTSCGDCKVCRQATCGVASKGMPCEGGFCDAAGSCLARHVGAPCATGPPGVCGEGMFECSGEARVCAPTIQPGSQREVCDGLDNDCDGVVDNDFDLMHDVNNCGRCGNVCNAPHGLAGCTQGRCVIDACNKGWAACNLDPQDGCETQIGTDATCGHCDDGCIDGKMGANGMCTSN